MTAVTVTVVRALAIRAPGLRAPAVLTVEQAEAAVRHLQRALSGRTGTYTDWIRAHGDIYADRHRDGRLRLTYGPCPALLFDDDAEAAALMEALAAQLPARDGAL